MEPESPQFKWTNFDFNMEIHVAGDFLYEGIYLIDRLSQLRYEDDYFLFLYDIAVGIERLEKIAYLLLALKDKELNPTTNWDNHKHHLLFELINSHTTLKLGKREMAFIHLLSEFYNKGRYDRFKYVDEIDNNKPTKDKDLFLKFFEKHLNVLPVNFIGQERTVILTQDLKDAIGEIVRGIVIPIYEIIRETAYALRLFTYEIRYGSKAYKLFIEQQFSFKNENTTKREVILKLINQKYEHDEYLDKIYQVQSLDLQQHTPDCYINYLMNFQDYPEIKDEVNQIYEDDELVNRASEIAFIGEKFEYPEQDEEDDSDEINIARFNVEKLFEEKIFKNGNRRIFIRSLNEEEIKLLCNILSIFKYKYNGQYFYLVVEKGMLNRLQSPGQIKEKLLRFIQDEIHDCALSREYRNAFLKKWQSLIPISLVKYGCPLMDTNSKLDHEVAMCVDIRYRNSYHKECLINYLKHNGFSYIHPQKSDYGYYYKKRTGNEYVVIDIVEFDDIKAQYIFDLLVVKCSNKRKYPIIGGSDDRIIVLGFNIFKHKAIIDDLFLEK